VPVGIMECWDSGILGIKNGRYFILITWFKVQNPEPRSWNCKHLVIMYLKIR
jgi:hypothetical protein